MNRYKGTLRIWTGEGAKEHPEWCTYEDNEWMRADEVDEVIMNMVSEFAETAKDYESEQTKAKEEIARLRKALEKCLDRPIKIQNLMRKYSYKVDDLKDPMQKLYFAIYTELCEIDVIAREALEQGKEEE